MLPYITTNNFSLLTWEGIAGGNLIPATFDENIYKKKYITIKGIKVIPYRQSDGDGITYEVYSDAITSYREGSLLGRIDPANVERGDIQGMLTIKLNGQSINILPSVASTPIDLDLDMLYLTFPNPLDSIELIPTFSYINNIGAGTLENCYVRILMQAYFNIFKNDNIRG